MSIFSLFRVYKKRYALFGILTIFTAFLLTHILPAGAETVIFDPLFVDRQVEVKSDETTKIVQNLHTHTWNSFGGEAPDGAIVEKISLILSWSESHVLGDTVQAEVTVPTFPDATVDDEGGANETTHVDLPIVESEKIEFLDEDLSTQIIEERSGEIESQVEIVEEVEAKVQDEAMQEEVESEDGALLPDAIIQESTENGGEVGFFPVLQQESYPLVMLGLEEKVNETLLSEEVIVNEALVISEDIENETTETFVTQEALSPVTEGGEDGVLSEAVSLTEETKIEDDEKDTSVPVLYPTRESADVLYSLDGDLWELLGTVNLLAGNEAEFDISMLSLEPLASLQVRVVYLAPQDAPPILFGNMQAKLFYTPGIVEEVIGAPSEREPNFLVSLVRADEASGRVRAVLLERGGLFEMWAGITDNTTGLIVWKKLASGDAIEPRMPIGVKSGTVFWFDRNAEMLYAYDVFSETVAGGVSLLREDGLREFSFIFGDGKRPWEVTYSPDTHTLEFTPALVESL